MGMGTNGSFAGRRQNIRMYRAIASEIMITTIPPIIPAVIIIALEVLSSESNMVGEVGEQQQVVTVAKEWFHNWGGRYRVNSGIQASIVFWTFDLKWKSWAAVAETVPQS